mgnify:CR=1 FL=1
MSVSDKGVLAETPVDISGLARKRDTRKSYLNDRGFLIKDAKDAFNAARSMCPRANSGIIGVCGIILSNSPTNVAERTGTQSVAECHILDAEQETCQSACERAINF